MLYLLRNLAGADWDENNGFVISAESPDHARRIASENARGEGKETWLSPTGSSCELLTDTAPVGVVIRDFHAG